MKVLDLGSSPFDVLTDRWVDRSGFGNHGKVYGAKPVSIAPGIMGYYFDGVDDYVDCGNDKSLNITDAITTEGFLLSNIESSAYSSNPSLISKCYNSAYELTIGNNKTFYMQITNDAGTREFANGGNWQARQWYHVTGTYDGTTIYLYINVKLIDTTPQNGNIGTNNEILGIGMSVNGNGYLNGLISKASINNDVQPHGRIKDHYHNSPLYKLQRGLRYR